MYQVTRLTLGPANLTTIYTQIRDVAHYHGLLVALTLLLDQLQRSDPGGRH